MIATQIFLTGLLFLIISFFQSFMYEMFTIPIGNPPPLNRVCEIIGMCGGAAMLVSLLIWIWTEYDLYSSWSFIN